MKLIAFLKDYGRNIRGATAIEYGLLVAGITLLIVGSIYLFGNAAYTIFYDELPTVLEG